MENHVSLGRRVCIVCCKEFDSNEILLATKYRPTRNGGMEPLRPLKRHTVTGWGMCPEHEKLRQDGFVALIGTDEALSDKLPNGNIKPEGAHRTGEVAHLKAEAFARIFNVPVPADKVAFCDPAVIEHLKHMQQAA